MESSSAGRRTSSPDSTTVDANSAPSAPAGGEPSSRRGDDNTGSVQAAPPAPGRTSEGARSTSGTGGGEQVTHQMTHSYSLSAIPTEQGQRDKKRPSARSSLPTGYTEASYRSEEYAQRQSAQQLQQQLAAHQQMDTLPRPYPPQSKSFGYAPKDLSRSMGSTALQREDSSSGGYAVESAMAKGDPGRAVRADYRAPVPQGLSRSLPKQSYFPDQEGERMYYPSRSALCLQELPQKQQYGEAYYPPHMLHKADPGGRVSSSSSFKPKRADDRYAEQQRYYDQYWGGYIHPMAAYDDVEYRKKMAAYTGDQRWLYSRYQPHPQQYAVHMMQESGENEGFREAGDTVVVKSSGDSGVSKYAAMAQKHTPEDISSMYVIVRDAQTGTDTPLPASAENEESPPPSKAAEMPLLGEGAARRDRESSRSSSSTSSSEEEDEEEEEEEEEEESSSEESSSRSATPVNPPHPIDYMAPEVVKERLLAHHLQQLQIQHQQQLMNMTPKEYARYQEALQIYENYCQQVHQQQQQQQLMMQHRQQIQQQIQQQNLLKRQSHQQLQEPPQQQQQQQQQPLLPPPQPPQQKSQQQLYQQQQYDPRGGPLPEKKKSVYFVGANTEGAGEMTARVPGEGSSVRSFHSRNSGDTGTGEASVEDNRSLLSSNTNMVTPLLRPLLPERAARTATKDKMEHLCLAVNVILFSVLAGVVAAFIVQQVTHAM
ncbi:hypothetical protein HPB50_017527 [Hyalomma asiaticum]|uniref:Uncharacterized protein n=1 Tax=Hyalomma asiaticum TaxID=266040 RepID=A0ACB7RZM9_HYAAI|nr:hypothetical protein HPB50_017527 [Hyalomma asiaticum]